MSANSRLSGKAFTLTEIGRAHSELQSRVDLVCRLLLEKKNLASDARFLGGLPNQAPRECRSQAVDMKAYGHPSPVQPQSPSGLISAWIAVLRARDPCFP